MKYKTIVIDPPWDLGATPHFASNHGVHHAKTTIRDMPYDTMSDAQITKFPIGDFAAEDCALFLWTTHGKLPAALSIIEAWKFDYKCIITWEKKRWSFGTSKYGSAGGSLCLAGIYRNTELLIHATRGKRILKNTPPLRLAYTAEAKGHSVKPDVIYEAIRATAPEPRIDIFARKRHPGFDAYGNQVEPVMQEVLV